MKKGFTLIEVLVVVLIIGILTSVALPQYQKSVHKARAAQALIDLKAIVDAAQVYYATFNKVPASLDDLDVTINNDWYDFTIASYWSVYAHPKKDFYPTFEWAGILNERPTLYCRTSAQICSALGAKKVSDADGGYWVMPL